MKILAIETSCDETAIAVIESQKKETGLEVKVLSNVVLSQIELHKEYGGVYPSLAKREHAKNLVPVLVDALQKADLYEEDEVRAYDEEKIKALLAREPELNEHLSRIVPKIKTPPFDAIAVTTEPGLEPALWVGINFAKALSILWDTPLLPVNHMEGHIFSALLNQRDETTFVLPDIKFPVLSLLISGGHTELVLMKDLFAYEVLGETQDDAVGEAFDKVARMLNLPYPGGPEISKLSAEFKKEATTGVTLPRPMVASGDYNFSFSGLKTAVRTLLTKHETITDELTKEVAHEFQNAVTEVLVKKTLNAVTEYGVQTFVAGGGVSANTQIRNALKEKLSLKIPEENIFLPPLHLTTDNALMIALIAALRIEKGAGNLLKENELDGVVANGTARLG